MPKFVLWIGLIFLAAGLALLGGAGWVEKSARAFDATALSASGTVIDMDTRSSDDGYVYAPVVEWRDTAGTRHRFVGEVASSPPAYDRGETVAIRFPPGLPGKARIADFSNRYLMTLVLGGLGAVFALVGGAIAFFYWRRRRTVAHLKQRGIPVEAKFVETRVDTSITVDGRHPFRVVAQAVHPSTGKVGRFESDPVWVDPTDALAGGTVRVLLDPQDAGSHFVDLSRWVDEADMV